MQRRWLLAIVGTVVVAALSAALWSFLHVDAMSDQSVGVYTETVEEIPQNATVISSGDSTIAEMVVLQGVLRDTIENGDGWREVEESKYNQLSRELKHVEEDFSGVLEEYDYFFFEFDGRYVIVSDTALI